MITPQELRKLTNEALENAAKERQRVAEAEAKKRREREAQDAARASLTISTIPQLAYDAAVKGQAEVVVVRLQYSEYTLPNGIHDYRICKPEWLQGAGKLIWDHCVNAGLKPTLEHWHDGVGVHEAFEIVIHW